MVERPAVSLAPTATPHNAGKANRAWVSALLLSLVILVGLDWILARIRWLPFYSGLFGYLVAGLLAGALSFRIASAARPLSRRRIIVGSIIVAVLGGLISVCWEFQHVCATIAQPPKFAEARNAAIRAGRSPQEIGTQGYRNFREQLRQQFPPGGPIGYARWAIAAGEMKLEIASTTESVSILHRGAVWAISTLVSIMLLAVGLWLSFEALRSSVPVTNVIAPGEEYEEV